MMLNQNNAHPTSKKPMILISLLVLVLALAGVGLALKHNHKSRTPTASEPYAYTYSKLESYKLDGAGQTGITTQKPTELQVPKNVNFSPGEALLLHTQSNPNSAQPITMATLGLGSTASTPPDKSYLDGLNKALQSNNFQQYQSLADTLKKYVTDRAGPYNFKFQSPKTLATDNIKSNAFSLSFTADPTSAGSKYGFQPIKGTAFMVFGQHGTYYITISSISYNWDANSSIWDKVINSIKVDQ